MDDADHPADLSRFHVAWLDHQGGVRAPLADAAATAFEEVPPVRDFPSYRGQRHFSGLYYSVTLDRHVGYESWLERDHAMLLDFDPQVTGFASQPFWLSWTQGRRGRSHAPDFFARRADGTGVVVDVRADDRVEPRDADAVAATEQACAQVGWLYRRVGEIERTRVTNLRWLAGYPHPRHGAPAGLAESVAAAFAIPAPLLVQAASVGDPVTVLPMVFHLLWQGVLTADLYRPTTERIDIAGYPETVVLTRLLASPCWREHGDLLVEAGRRLGIRLQETAIMDENPTAGVPTHLSNTCSEAISSAMLNETPSADRLAHTA